MGSKSLVFTDESGFEDNQYCIYAWWKKGKKVYGEQKGKRGKRENLVAGRRNKDLIAPIIFKVTLNAVGFEQWMVRSTFITIIKNSQCTAAWIIHQLNTKKNVIRELVEAGSHQLLFLPKYSPDLNDIEHNFSALKRARMYSPINTSIDEIIRNYCAK